MFVVCSYKGISDGVFGKSDFLFYLLNFCLLYNRVGDFIGYIWNFIELYIFFENFNIIFMIRISYFL